MTISDEQLAMAREKPRLLSTSFSYRAAHLARRILGRERALRVFLNGSRLMWQFAYELSGEIYDNAFHTETKALNEDLLRRLLPPDATVIDIGCGSGRWCRVAAPYAAHVVGIDSDKSEIDRALSESAQPNIEFVHADFRDYSRNRTFDLALLAHVIEHIDEADLFLRDVREIAERIIIEVPDFENDPLNWVRLRQGCPFYTDADHVREYTVDGLTRQVEKNGWRVIESRKNGGSVLVAAERV